MGRNQVAPRVKELYLVMRGGGMGDGGFEQGLANAVNSNTCHPVEAHATPEAWHACWYHAHSIA